MSKFTEWRDETEARIAAWWKGAPMARGIAYGFAAGCAFVAALWGFL